MGARYVRRVGCIYSGKIAYTRDEAQRAVRRLLFIEQDEQNADALHAYKCGRCGRWHIGHAAKPRSGVESSAMPPKSPRPNNLGPYLHPKGGTKAPKPMPAPKPPPNRY